MKNILKTFAVALVALAGHAQADSLALGSSSPGVPLVLSDFKIGPVVEGGECDNFRPGDIGMSEDGLILSCQSGVWHSNSGGQLQCHTTYVARWTPSNINDLSYGSANWCSPGYSMVGWDTRGADGRNVSGGAVGNINAWAFCCKVQ